MNGPSVGGPTDKMRAILFKFGDGSGNGSPHFPSQMNPNKGGSFSPRDPDEGVRNGRSEINSTAISTNSTREDVAIAEATKGTQVGEEAETTQS